MLFPLPAVLFGAYIMKAHSIPARIWGLNIGVLVVGSLVVACLGRWKGFASVGNCNGFLFPLAAVSAVALSLCFEGSENVHRWLIFGGMTFHIGSMALPVFLI